MKVSGHRKSFLVLCMLICCVSADSRNSRATFPNDIVQLAWFYKPPKDGNLQVLSKNYRMFILTKNDEEVRDQIKKQSPNFPILQYLRFDAIQDPDSCSAQPYRNQVADQPGDFCDITQRYADWFLNDIKGNRIQERNYYVMDPGNHLWRLFWLDRAKESQEKLNWEGVFLDNVEASLQKLQQNAALPRVYRNGQEYQAAVEGFLSYICRSYFKPAGRPLFANIIALTDTATWFRYLQYLDGAMLEAFAVDWERGYRKVEQWEQQLQIAEKTQEIGKRIILVSQGAKEDVARQQFSYGSYLLVSSGRASFRYTRATHYNEQWFYPNYDSRLGRPLGRRYKKGSLWKRDFEFGTVHVDPAAHTAEITSK